MKPARRAACWWILLLAAGAFLEPDASAAPRGGRVLREFLLNDDGGWCWFQDERAVIVDGRLYVGSVASGHRERERRGHVEIVSLDLATGARTRLPLHPGFELDDHDAPALVPLRDGTLLASWARHGTEPSIYLRRTAAPGQALRWEPLEVVVPSPSSRATYANLLAGREDGAPCLYHFFRGLDGSFKPSWMVSRDDGRTWRTGGLLVDFQHGNQRHRPYVKYAADDRGTIHLAFTEAHPRDFDNGIYHAVLRNGVWRRSDGAVVRPLREGPVTPADATRVFEGGPENVAWIQDLAVDGPRQVRLAYSVQKDSAGLPPGQGGMDHRYRWARWNGRGWDDAEIAFAGTRLYAGEDDYVGGICLHPDDPDVVFISTDVDPVDGQPLVSGVHEIFQGRRNRDGEWTWRPVTPGATVDQLRPLVPRWRRGRTALLWLRGEYRSYTDYRLEVMAQIDGAGR